MITRGWFVCTICKERLHVSEKNEVTKSYFPRETIGVCDACKSDWRHDPEYEHLRPDINPEEREKIQEKREYCRETHIYL